MSKDYNDIKYSFFGTVSGTPGIAYYYSSPKRLDEANNMQYICEILYKAKQLDGKNLGNELNDEVNQNIEDTIES